MSVGTAVGLVLALASTTLTNLAYLREHDAAAELPVLSMRRPVHSARLLLHSLERGLDPGWDAANEVSVGLAKKLGYTFQGKYTMFVVVEED